MSDSPTSTRLETPLSTRTSRARKPVKHYGSFLDSDQLPEDEDHQEEDDVVDDEDESFKVKGGKEESEDEVEGDEIVLGDGSEDEIDFVCSLKTRMRRS